VAVTGDLTVNGTTTTVNSTTVTVDDPIFTLGGDSAPGSDDNKDRGIEFRWHNGSAAKVGFFGYDDSAGAFTFIPDATNSSEVFSGTAGNVAFGDIAGTLTTAAQTNITSVGALDGGSITSGFGAIDVGSSAITTTGTVTGGTLAGTLSTAAQTNITSLGTLSTLTVDNVIINGTTIGHTDDTDLMTLASGGLTVAGTIEGTTITASTALVPDASGGADLGSTSLEWGDLYIADDKKIYLGSDQNFSIEYDEDGNDTTAVVAANGVSFAPHGSSAGNGTELRFQELAANGANYVGFKAPDAIASNEVWVLPNADGSDGQVLKTDGSNTLSWADAGGGGTVNKVADGAIAIRKPVVLTDAGKAQQVAESLSYASSPTAVFSTMDNSDTTNAQVSSAYESNSGAYAMVYKDTAGSSYGTCVCGTWSDGTMTWGTPVVFESSAIDDTPHITAGGNRIHVTYRDSSGNGGIRSASISGTTPTFAAETVWGSPQSTLGTTELSTTHGVASGKTIDTVYDTTSDRFVTIYADSGNSNYGTAVVHYISNTGTGATTYGTPVVFESGDISDNGKGATISADTNTSRVVIAYRDGGDSNNGKAIVGSVTSGTNAISFGTAATFNAASTQFPVIVEDPNANKQAIFYRNLGGDSGHGYGIVGTVTGGTDNSIAFGTATEFHGVDTQQIAAAYSPDTNKILVAYADVPSSGQITGQSNVATISGTSISFGSQDEWEPQRPILTSMAYDETANKFVIAYNNQDESSHGYMIVGTMSGTDMTYGSDVKYEANSIDNIEVGYDPSQGKCYIMSYNTSNDDLRMETVTISGTTPSNSTFVVDSTEPGNTFMGTAYDSDNGLVVVNYTHGSDDDLRTSVVKAADGYQPGNYHAVYDTANDYVVIMFYFNPSVYIRAVSHNTGNGTYTAVGAKTILNTGNIISIRSDMVYDPDTNRAVVAYMDNTNSDYMTSNVVQLGGTAAAPTVTIGSDVVIDSGDGSQIAALTYDTTNNKVFLAYDNNGDGKVRGAIGTVTSGTNAISFTTPADIWDYSSGGDYFDVIYDDDKDRVMFFYRDDDNSNALTYKIITSGASSFSVADGAVISSSDNRLNSGAASFGAGKGVLVALWDSGNSSKVSYATTRFVATTVSTLDNGNYLGIAAEAISDTATGKIIIPGGISEGHSSLTIGNHYFTNGAGAIGLVGNTTGEQYLGRAISATEIQLLENEGYLYGTAEGAVTKGTAVIVEADGDFKNIAESGADVTQGFGTPVETADESSVTYGPHKIENIGENSVIAMYQGTSNYPRCKVGTITGGTKAISWGAEVVVASESIYSYPFAQTITWDSGNNRGLFTWSVTGTSFAKLRAAKFTVSGTTPTVSSAVDVRDKMLNAVAVFDPDQSDHILAVMDYNSGTSAYDITVHSMDISGTTPSSAYSTTSANRTDHEWGPFMSIDYDTNVNKALLCFEVQTGGDLVGASITNSGTAITIGANAAISNASLQIIGGTSDTVFVPTNPDGDDINKFMVTFADNSSGTNVGQVFAPVTIASDGTVSTGSLVYFPVDTDTNDASHYSWSLCYDQTAATALWFGRSANGSDHFPILLPTTINSSGAVVTGTRVEYDISGTNDVLSTNSRYQAPKKSNSNDESSVPILYHNATDSDKFYTAVFGYAQSISTTVTTENYIGIATKTVADNEQVEVATFGQIDAQQSGLTAGQLMYIQLDGTLGTTAASPSVVAGRALSATKLLISNS